MGLDIRFLFGYCSSGGDCMKNLTKRQKEIFDFIKNFSLEHGYSPSYREIGEHFGYRSLATVFDHIESLRQKGYLQKDPALARSLKLTAVTSKKTYEIPLIGSIAAGKPIEAITTSETIQIPKDMMAKGVFALKVKGDSMVEEGIFDGDYVIIQPTQTAENGDIVVALIDNDKVTLKKFYKDKNFVWLKPANAKIKPMKMKKVVIQGKVKGIIRKFK